MSDRQAKSGPATPYSIGEAAQASGLTTKAIRYYEQINLIPKALRRNSENAPHTGGDRVYGDDDVARLRFIHHARLVDLKLADIRELVTIADQMGCPSGQPLYNDILNQHLQKIDDRIDHLLSLRVSVARLLNPDQPIENDRCTWTNCDCMATDSALSPIGIVIEKCGPRT